MTIGPCQPPEEVLRCSFCRKTQDAAAKLISSPSECNRAYICDQCVRVGSRALDDMPAPSGHRSGDAPGCSFCRQGPDVVRLVASSGDTPLARICEDCLAVCWSILHDDVSPIAN